MVFFLKKHIFPITFFTFQLSSIKQTGLTSFLYHLPTSYGRYLLYRKKIAHHWFGWYTSVHSQNRIAFKHEICAKTPLQPGGRKGIPL